MATLATATDARPAQWLEARVRDAGTLGLADAHLPARCGLAPAVAQALASELARTGRVAAIGASWVATGSLDLMRSRILAVVDAARVSDPMAGGVPRATLRTLGGRRWRAEIADHVLTRLVADGVLHGDERLSRPEAMASGRDPAEARVLALVQDCGLKGLTASELEAAGTGLDRKALGAVLSRLVKSRDVDRVGDLYIATADLRALSNELRRLAGTGEAPTAIEVGWFKERYGLTRRSAIPLLEWLDRTRVTRRQGDTRVLIGLPQA
jgi:selenocysteine-specific elongation factor